MSAYAKELEEAHDAIAASGIKPQQWGALVDLRNHSVQSKEIVQRFQEIGVRYAALPKRIANLLSGQALQKLQAQRIATSARQRFFDDEHEALAWLCAP